VPPDPEGSKASSRDPLEAGDPELGEEGEAAIPLVVRDTIRSSFPFDGPTATTFTDLFEDCSSR
jgi:hypothetical protein